MYRLVTKKEPAREIDWDELWAKVVNHDVIVAYWGSDTTRTVQFLQTQMLMTERGESPPRMADRWWYFTDLHGNVSGATRTWNEFVKRFAAESSRFYIFETQDEFLDFLREKKLRIVA